MPSRILGQPCLPVVRDLSVAAANCWWLTSWGPLSENAGQRKRQFSVGQRSGSWTRGSSSHFRPASTGDNRRRRRVLAQSESDGGSNNASSAASGAWKRATHSSRWLRRIGELARVASPGSRRSSQHSCSGRGVVVSEWKQRQLERQARFWEQVRAGATFTAACGFVRVEHHQGYRWRKVWPAAAFHPFLG